MEVHLIWDLGIVLSRSQVVKMWYFTSYIYLSNIWHRVQTGLSCCMAADDLELPSLLPPSRVLQLQACIPGLVHVVLGTEPHPDLINWAISPVQIGSLPEILMRSILKEDISIFKHQINIPGFGATLTKRKGH